MKICYVMIHCNLISHTFSFVVGNPLVKNSFSEAFSEGLSQSLKISIVRKEW